MILYHGGTDIIEKPEIRSPFLGRDFGKGFYCTDILTQFDIVYGRIANDDVGETVQAILDGLMPLDYALQKLSFMQSNNQYSFCTDKSLEFLQFVEHKKAG